MLVDISQWFVSNTNFFVLHAWRVLVVQLIRNRDDAVNPIFFKKLQVDCCSLVAEEKPTFGSIGLQNLSDVIGVVFIDLYFCHRFRPAQ